MAAKAPPRRPRMLGAAPADTTTERLAAKGARDERGRERRRPPRRRRRPRDVGESALRQRHGDPAPRALGLGQGSSMTHPHLDLRVHELPQHDRTPLQDRVRRHPAAKVAQDARLGARGRVQRTPRKGPHADRSAHGRTQASVQCRSLVVRTAAAGMPRSWTIARISSDVRAARREAASSARCRSCMARIGALASGMGA